MTSFGAFFDIFVMNVARYRRFLSFSSKLTRRRQLCGWVSNYFQFNLTILSRTIYIVSDLIVVPFYYTRPKKNLHTHTHRLCERVISLYVKKLSLYKALNVVTFLFVNE